MSRHAGVLLPLFSAASSGSWGIGEFPDIAPLTAWLGGAGFDRLLLLPINAVPAAESSPYSAWSAMALDERYVAWAAVDDFRRAGGVSALDADARDRLEAARDATTIAYADVLAAKAVAGRLAFDQHAASGDRGAELESFATAEAWWLDDYALFRAIDESTDGAPWWTWEPGLRSRDGGAMAEARRTLDARVRRHQYVQWQAHRQWQEARSAARRAGVALYGDLAFTIAAHSADAWAHQQIFRRDISTGAPPDAFSAVGQNWHLPSYDWEVLERTGYAWIGDRVRRMSALFDGLRIDHLVGLYRTFGWPDAGEPFFSPSDEASQLRQGEAVLGLFTASGLDVIAEDLGTVPDFVRQSLARLGIPGTKILRWERAWHEPQQPFLDPAAFPVVSATMTGTHDTDPLAAWWDGMRLEERALMVALPVLRDAGVQPGDSWGPRLRDLLLRTAFGASSDDVFVPWPDLFGWPVRINVPGTIGDHNWSWRMPWPVDQLQAQPEATERSVWCRTELAAASRVAVR